MLWEGITPDILRGSAKVFVVGIVKIYLDHVVMKVVVLYIQVLWRGVSLKPALIETRPLEII